MEVSKEIIKLAEKIRAYRIDTKLIKEIEIKKEILEKHVEELEEIIKNLKEENSQLKFKLEKEREAYTFIVTTSKETSNITVYGEINRELSKAKEEVLICSPWITHIDDEFSDFKKRKDKKKINIKIITRLVKEDIEKGMTDLNKLRVLENLGAEIRYNNELHAKMVVVDNSIAIISSANLTKRGLSTNYEAGICLKNRDNINKVTQFFNDIWDESKPLTKKAIEDASSKRRA